MIVLSASLYSTFLSLSENISDVSISKDVVFSEFSPVSMLSFVGSVSAVRVSSALCTEPGSVLLLAHPDNKIIPVIKIPAICFFLILLPPM